MRTPQDVHGEPRGAGRGTSAEAERDYHRRGARGALASCLRVLHIAGVPLPRRRSPREPGRIRRTLASESPAFLPARTALTSLRVSLVLQDATLLLSASGDRTVKLWNLKVRWRKQTALRTAPKTTHLTLLCSEAAEVSRSDRAETRL